MDLACETHKGQLVNRPLIYLDLFSGEGSFSQWIKHFKSAAAINRWDDETKLKWLHAGKRKSYPQVIESLHEWFKASAKVDLYRAELQHRSKQSMEFWEDFADEVVCW